MKKFIGTAALLLITICAIAKTYTVRGKVVDENRNPIVGADIYLKNTKQGTVSDVNGEYILTNVEDGVKYFEASYIGYNTDARSLNIDKDLELDFQLLEGVLLNELVVTAQKREQSIKDIPTALTTISGKFIEQTGYSEIDQLASYIPGLEVQVQSPNNPGFVVRGITSDDGSANVEPRVSIFQDGVSISKSRGSVVELFDMQRVEVLKGPQGTLFGRGAQIGAIHLIQNKPKNYLDAGLTLGLGNYNYRHAEFFGNAPIVKDKFLARISGIYKKRDGFIENQSGGDLNGKDTKAIRATLKWLLSPKTDFTLIGNYQKDTPPGTAFKSGKYAPTNGDTSPHTFADLERGNELGIKRDVWGITLLGEHRFNRDLSLTSITAYREFDSDESFDADGTAAPALFFHEESKGEQFSQELRLNFTLGENFKGFAGGNFFSEDGSSYVPLETDERSFLALVSPLASSLINKNLGPLNELYKLVKPGYPEVSFVPVDFLVDGIPVLPSTPGDLLSNPLIPLSYIPEPYKTQVAPLYGLMGLPLSENHTEYYKNYGNNKAYEFFADGSYNITEKLKLTGGVRFSIEKIQSSYEAGGDGKAHLGLVRAAGSNLLFMPTEKITSEDTFHSWVGRLALNYAISEDWELYGTASKGRRPNVIQFKTKRIEDGTFTSKYISETLNDEIVNSYEIGLKGLTLLNQLYFDLSAFYYDYSDFQTSSIDKKTLQPLIDDAGDATAYGVETSIRWKINDHISMFGNYSYINAEFSDTDSNDKVQSLAGNTFRLTPEHSFMVGSHLKWDIANNFNLFFRPVYHYKSKVYFEETNLDVESQEGYGLLDGRFGFEFPEFKLKLSFFMNNILDEEYLIDAGNVGRSFEIPTFISGPPRLWGMELNFRL